MSNFQDEAIGVDVREKIKLDVQSYDNDDIFDKSEEQENPSGPRLLMVKGSKAEDDPGHVISLARAIMISLSEHNVAELQAIGAPSVNNMQKAFIKAKSMLQDYVTDSVLVSTSGYQKVRIDGKIITAIKMRIFAVPLSVTR